MKYILISFLLLFSLILFPQFGKKDSLLELINKNNLDDTTKLLNIKKLSYYYLFEEGNIDEALLTSKALIISAEKTNSQLWLGRSYSVDAYIKSNYTADYNGAVKSFYSAIKCFETINNNSELLTVYINLGATFYRYKEYNNSKIYYLKAEKIAQSLNSKDDLGNIYMNLGGVNETLNNDSIAREYYIKSKTYFTEANGELELAKIDFNMANLLIKKNINNPKTRREIIEICLKAKDVFKKYEDENAYLSCIISLGGELTLVGDLKEGNTYLQEAKTIALQIKDYRNLINVFDRLATNANLRGDSFDELEALKSYIIYNDSLFEENKSKAINELQTKYETDKKEKENQVLTLENKNKKQVIYFAFGGCALLLGLVFFVFKGYKQKQKANQELEVKNEIIHQQKTIVEEQHQDIKDSIKYAQRIQGAILPPKNMWQKILPNSFLLYMPKDVLSGDFYWVEETKDYVYVAAADCTGHGVPGALISIVNFNLLNKAVLEKDLVTPSEILDAVNIWLTESLHQTYGESTVRDGMDVTLIAIHKHSNEVLFAGANNPIYHITNGELHQIKGDKFPVGAFIEDKIQKFTTKRFTVEKGDSIFLFSDGFADQFGGPKGKKYKYAQFQEKLIANYNSPLSQQYDTMKKEFLDWKGTHEQVDDVLLIGIKIA